MGLRVIGQWGLLALHQERHLDAKYIATAQANVTELLLHLPGRFAIALASPTLISPLPTTRLSIVRQASYLSQTLLLTVPQIRSVHSGLPLEEARHQAVLIYEPL